jgi:hypothetical protein
MTTLSIKLLKSDEVSLWGASPSLEEPEDPGGDPIAEILLGEAGIQMDEHLSLEPAVNPADAGQVPLAFKQEVFLFPLMDAPQPAAGTDIQDEYQVRSDRKPFVHAPDPGCRYPLGSLVGDG